MSTQGPGARPGWYPDPQHPGTQRYWDGAKWTEHRAPVGPPPVMQGPPVQPKPQGGNKAVGCLAAGVVGIILLCGAGAIFGGDSDSGPGGDGGDGGSDEGNGFVAESMCEDWVEDRLKSPSTADFSDVEHSGNDPWTITGNVDSENSFGAMIRNSFTCKVRYAGNDKYQLVDLEMSNN